MTQKQIAELWVKEGGNPAKADEASAIAMAESGGNVKSNSNPCCKGLYQINVEVGNTSLKCALNANCATQWAIAHSNNGTNWKAWETYTNGAYKKYLGKSGYKGKSSSEGCKPFGGNQLGTVAAGAASGGAAGLAVPIPGADLLTGGAGALIGGTAAFLGSNTLGGCSPIDTSNVNPLSGIDLVGKAIEAIAKLFEDLFTAHFWVRAGKGLAGGVLLIYAIQGMMKATLGIELPIEGINAGAFKAAKGLAGK